jgi:hypothetical protein
MAFSLEQFARIRPYLYHLTATDNLGRIRSCRSLESAESLMLQAGPRSLQHQRRAVHSRINVGGITVSLRDQSPLHEGNISFEAGWTFQKLLVLLNQRVFFWPGTADGPIEYGMRHYTRYESEQPAVLRVQTRSLLRRNQHNPPLFCKYNSGSPRCSGGIRSPRGPSTFQAAGDNQYTPGSAIEVTFVCNALLPDDAELRGKSWCEWLPLFASATTAADPSQQ